MSSLQPGQETNAGLTFRLLREGGRRARLSLYYEPGIQWTSWTQAQDVIQGRGMNRQIRRAYGFLASHYRPGDRIYLFGYSRGAYAVRSLAGVIDRVGLVRADQATERHVTLAYRHYQTAPDAPAARAFAAEEAEEMGLHLDDSLTVNILGRDIVAKITSFRVVDFSNAGMGFVMTMNPAAVAGAPHTEIATVYADTGAEAGILRTIASAYPNITAISVKAAIGRVGEALTAIAQATTIAAMATLLTGFVVLIGAAASGERARVYEASVLKVLGASRGRILASFALRAGSMGAAAGCVAIAAGAIGAWAVMRFVMEVDYAFEPISALAIVLGGILATLLASLVFVLRPLAARPAQVLRAQE